MIAIHIITENKEMANSISTMLLENRLMLKPFIIDNNPECLIIGRTKALLFNKIYDQIHNMGLKNIPVVYSIPILNMEWGEVSSLQTSLEQA